MASEWLLVETQVTEEDVSCLLIGSPLLATLSLAIDKGEKNLILSGEMKRISRCECFHWSVRRNEGF